MWGLFFLVSLNHLERNHVPRLQGSCVLVHSGIHLLSQRCAEDLLCVRTYCVSGTVLGAQGEGEARSLPRGLSRSSKPGIL